MNCLSRRKNLLCVIFLALLAGPVLLACSPSESQREENLPSMRTSDDLAGIDTYRMRTVLEWVPESGDREVVETAIEATRDPPARRVLVRTGEGISQEWVQIGETGWYCENGSCSLQPSDGEGSFGEEILLWDEQLHRNFARLDPQYLGEEPVHGVKAYHFLITSPPPDLFGPLNEDATEATSDIWVANEEGLPTFVVRVVTRWNLAEPVGEGTFSTDVYDINAVFTIAPPTEVPSTTSEDIPLYPFGTQVMAGGEVSFSAQATCVTVTDFYRTELPVRGWSLEAEQQSQGTFIQRWSKDGWCLDVAASSRGEGCSVTLAMALR